MLKKLFQSKEVFHFQVEILRAYNVGSAVSDCAQARLRRKKKKFTTASTVVDDMGNLQWQSECFILPVTLYRSKSHSIWQRKVFVLSIKSNTSKNALRCKIDFAHFASLLESQSISQTLPLQVITRKNGIKKIDKSGSFESISDDNSSYGGSGTGLSVGSSIANSARPKIVVRITRVSSSMNPHTGAKSSQQKIHVVSNNMEDDSVHSVVPPLSPARSFVSLGKDTNSEEDEYHMGRNGSGISDVDLQEAYAITKSVETIQEEMSPKVNVDLILQGEADRGMKRTVSFGDESVERPYRSSAADTGMSQNSSGYRERKVSDFSVDEPSVDA